MLKYALNLVFEERAQDVAEYALLLAVIVVIAATTIIALGKHATDILSKVASALTR